MKNWQILLSIVFFILAIVIFVFASGARRVYSGVFFTLLGIAILVSAKIIQNKEREENK